MIIIHITRFRGNFLIHVFNARGITCRSSRVNGELTGERYLNSKVDRFEASLIRQVLISKKKKKKEGKMEKENEGKIRTLYWRKRNVNCAAHVFDIALVLEANVDSFAGRVRYYRSPYCGGSRRTILTNPANELRALLASGKDSG